MDCKEIHREAQMSMAEHERENQSSVALRLAWEAFALLAWFAQGAGSGDPCVA